ncbi:MAG: 3-deoxy-D-manno-octulosonic acid transferase [Bacteroidetes bacterium]|nr:MAG: 3-deoxy-D-manno-octulosonic acid transferase [Bacteroidota bacterium]
MRLIYNTGIYLYKCLIHFAALFNSKASDFVKGRKDTFPDLKTFRGNIGDAPLIWIHSASLGEFEQGRPVIEQLKKSWPEYKILLTFFSPSGYNIRKDYDLADHVCYLPMDTPGNALRFYKAIRPDLAVFVKYEFWYNHLSVLKKHKVPHILISAIFRQDQVFFKWYGGFFKRLLKGFDHIFVQDQGSRQLLRNIGIEHCSLAGDTRVDRVSDIAKQAKRFPEIEQFVGNSKVFVAGSTWPKGEEVICPLINNDLPEDWKVILAPHEITEGHLKDIEKRLELTTIRYSKLEINPQPEARVLIIDNIGMLASLYKYGTLAYIGGGFGVGIHNILEPATFGLPVLFGPNHEKFREAVELRKRGGAFSVSEYDDLNDVFKSMLEEKKYAAAKNASRSFIDENKGATDLIISYLAGKFITRLQAKQ